MRHQGLQYPFAVPSPAARPNLGGCGCEGLGEEPKKANVAGIVGFSLVLVLVGAIVYHDVSNARTK